MVRAAALHSHTIEAVVFTAAVVAVVVIAAVCAHSHRTRFFSLLLFEMHLRLIYLHCAREMCENSE